MQSLVTCFPLVRPTSQGKATLPPAWILAGAHYLPRALAACGSKSTGAELGKGKRGKGRAKSHGKKQKKPEVDILSPAAMLNLYYIAHNVADCLHLRGFRWPGFPLNLAGSVMEPGARNLPWAILLIPRKPKESLREKTSVLSPWPTMKLGRKGIECKYQL
ncbi:hypothetical protein MC885_017582 [Smutsia gigantea]|nr:hypothetical protein MC885_017582 [Smutsia gigantea]